MPNLVDLSGRRFGRLIVVRKEASLRKRVMWRCICDCGKEIWARGANLKQGNIKSCGCLKRDQNRELTKHGHARRSAISSEWHSWRSMRIRCKNPNNKSFERYGGRGITICERWETFENFLMDMGRKPTPQHTIERINNNGNYEPTNCRWATPKEQRTNQRKPRRDYDAENDFGQSILECYAEIRARRAKGGKGWGGWE